jgi:ABC-type phosphate transport system substrate-binding protein
MKRILVGSAVAAAAVLAAPSDAFAADCSTLTNPVYIAGSSAVQAILKQVSPILQAQTPPVNIVYASQGSCVGMQDITDPQGTPIPAGTAVIWDSTGTAGSCTIPVGGHAADIGVSDVFPTTCPSITLPATLKDFQGPVQTMTFIVPAASTQSSISADAAYAVLGWGGAMYPVMPWNDQNQLFIRNATSGTQQMIATAIGLGAAKWKGIDKMNSGGVVTAVAGSTAPQTALGIVVTGNADPVSHSVANATLKILAYQHTGQKCGYYPDSSSTTFDKLNVRQGRYAIWGPLHLVAAVDGQGVPTNASAKTVINYFTRNGLNKADTKSMIDGEIAAHAVPQCAMQVSRNAEIGAEASYAPVGACGCYFESKVGTASAGCHTCNMDTDCSGTTPKCNYGYCEAQ